MPFAPTPAPTPKKKEEEGGILGGLSKLGKIASNAALGVRQGTIEQAVANQDSGSVLEKNLGGALDFMNPAHQIPGLLGLGTMIGSSVKEIPRTVTTLPLANAYRNDLQGLENSPLSFLANTELLRNAQKDVPLADLISSQIQQVAPAIESGAEAVAGTGIRGGAEAAAGLSRTGKFGPQATAAELLKGTKMEGQDYATALQEGKLFPMAVQDILTAAPALRGVAGGLRAAGGGAAFDAATAATEAANAEAAAAHAGLVAPAAPGPTVFSHIPNVGDVAGWEAEAAQAAALPPVPTSPFAGLPAPPAAPLPVAPGLVRAADALTQAANFAERAPLAPYSEAAKAITRAIGRTGVEGVAAFPKLAALAEQGIPVASKLAGTVEGATQLAGTIQKRAGFRGEFLGTEAEVFNNAKDELAAHDTNIAQFDKNTPEHLDAVNQKAAFEADLIAEAKNEAKYNIQKDVRTKMSPEELAVQAEKEAGPSFTKVGSTPTRYKIPEAFSDAEIAKAFKGLDHKSANNFALKVFDDVTSAWKTGVLPLNPSWQAGNVVSNAMTAMIHGGVNPIWFWQNRNRIKEEMDSGTLLQKGSLGRGSSAEFAATEASSKLGRGSQKVSKWSYTANEYVDNIGHAAVALKEYDRLIASGMPKAQAIRAANTRALQVMGDFANMSAFEKNVVRRAVPFYAWSKHSAKMALREGMNNPVKQLRLATTANVFNQQPTLPENASFLDAALPMAGGKFLNVPGSNMEQGLVGGIAENPLANPAAALGATSPIFQATLAGIGINARKGRELRTAPGQSYLSGAAGYATNLSPGSKAIADMVERYQRGGILAGDNTVKGDVRNPLVAGGHPILDTKQDLGFIPAPLLKFLTGASIDKPNLAASNARAAKTNKANAKQKTQYNTNVTKKAK